MCIKANFDKPTITTEPILAYKVVAGRHGGEFGSVYHPGKRSQQHGFKTAGKHRRYVIGKRCQSSMRSTPGFYCYRDVRTAQNNCWLTQSVLRVKIPAGTKIVEGKAMWTNAEVICCERLTVEAVMP